MAFLLVGQAIGVEADLERDGRRIEEAEYVPIQVESDGGGAVLTNVDLGGRGATGAEGEVVPFADPTSAIFTAAS